MQEAMVENDAYACYTFDTRVNKLHSFMKASTVDLAKDMKNIQAEASKGGGTALYDAITQGVQEIKRHLAEKQAKAAAMKRPFVAPIVEHVVITDGEDNSSRHTLAQTAALLAQPGICSYNLSFLGVQVAGSTTRVFQQLTTAHHCHYVEDKSEEELVSKLATLGKEIRIKVIRREGRKAPNVHQLTAAESRALLSSITPSLKALKR
jgi:uncharacterized protein YegL